MVRPGRNITTKWPLGEITSTDMIDGSISRFTPRHQGPDLSLVVKFQIRKPRQKSRSTVLVEGIIRGSQCP